jgi:hypothetical protein
MAQVSLLTRQKPDSSDNEFVDTLEAELAKKTRGRPPGSGKKAAGLPETVGSALGTVMAKVDAWMRQRDEIAHELRAVADRMTRGENPFPWRKGSQASSAPAAKAGRGGVTSDSRKRKRSTMSPAQRKAVSERMKKYWAARRKAEKRA